MQDDSEILLSVHAEGPAADGGRLPLAEIARIAAGLQVTLERVALALTGTYVARGRRPRDVVEAVRLDLAGFRAGSAIIDVIRADRPEAAEVEGDSLLADSLRALEDGITAIRKGGDLPPYFTPQVVTGLRELAGGINVGNLTRISFGRPGGQSFVIDSIFRDRLRKVSTLGPQTEATVVGRLQMGDFSPAALRCRIDTFAGSVLADFGDELRDSVLDAMDQMVMATGIADMQPDGSTVRVLHLSALERLPSARTLPLATLQRQQGVSPVSDISDLRGHAEDGDDFGSFMEAITSARRGDK
ncbi:MAG TPA: hypothetical protein VMU95_26720 [Trebonia sp.]|nr:hypothetical protein [Trebonia sp.]